MTLDFYNLKEQPFGTIPDPRFLFVSSAHRQALGSVLVALENDGGFVSLVGQAGLGKTTLLFHMFNTLKENVTTIYLFQAPQTPVDLMRAILADLGVREINEIPMEMLALLKELLADEAARQKKVVVIIDDAQNLNPSVLELISMLSNLAGTQGRLMQFVLCGQFELRETVVLPEDLELTYRAPIVARLEPLSADDTAVYMDHRTRIAGYDREVPLFSPEANALIAKYSEGIPRKINNLCFSSMLLGYKTKRQKIEGDVVQAVISDLGLDRTLQERVIRPLEAPRAVPELPGRVISTPMEQLEASRVAERSVARRPARPAENVVPMVASAYTRASVPPAPSVAERMEPRSLRSSPSEAKVRESSAFSRLAPKIGLAAAVLLTVSSILVNVRRHVTAPVRTLPMKTYYSPPPAASPSLPRDAAMPAGSAKPAPPKGGHVAPPSAAARLAPPAAAPDLKGMDLKAAVHALSGRSLNAVCQANFGQCDGKLLQEMHRVNTRLVPTSHSAASPGHAPPTNKVSDAASDPRQKAALASSN